MPRLQIVKTVYRGTFRMPIVISYPEFIPYDEIAEVIASGGLRLGHLIADQAWVVPTKRVEVFNG